MSPVFRKMLDGEMHESRANKIVITDFPRVAVEAFVHYLYYDDILDDPVDLNEYSVDLWGLGEKYEVVKLQKLIANLQAQFVTVHNVVDLLSRVEVYGASTYKDFCLRFMVKNAKSITGHEEVLKAMPHNLLMDYVLACNQFETFNVLRRA